MISYPKLISKKQIDICFFFLKCIYIHYWDILTNVERQYFSLQNISKVKKDKSFILFYYNLLHLPINSFDSQSVDSEIHLDVIHIHF